MNTDGSSMSIDPNLAKKLYNDGSVLIIAGVPKHTEFGIDLCSYTVDDNFRGIKMIPKGVHYVWCASQGPYGDSAPRVGFIHYFQGGGEIVIREWSHAEEELRERQIAEPELEKQRIRENIKELDKYLAPYDYRFLSQWKHLIDCVSSETVERCRPQMGTIRTNMQLQSCSDADRPRGSKLPTITPNTKLLANEDDLLPNLKPIEGTAPRFTDIPSRIPKGSAPADVSRHCMDCLAAIDALLAKFANSTALIEEIQISFVFFLVGYSVESLAQWRKLLNLLAHSENAVVKYRLLYMKYSEVLALQLPHLPEELMTASESNTVYRDVRSLLLNLNLAQLGPSAERLAQKLRKSCLHWEFAGLLDDDPEEQPVVVET